MNKLNLIMIKYFLLLIILSSGILMAQDIEFANNLYYNYQNYKEASLNNRRIKHQDIVSLIDRLKSNPKFNVNIAGNSAENRSIYLIKAGTGKTKIFLWSQMHGDESTATMAIFDIFNFLSSNDFLNDFRNKLLQNVTLYFMPMVNPDGAEVFQRRNDFEIDINRDAISQQTPEGKILKGTFDSLKADFGFNMHDQSIYHSAGHSFKPATLSFLAPADNYEKTIDTVRSNAMKVIGQMYQTLSSFIPGHIAKYSDDFEPRAFGDNFQKWGTSTILIESGGWGNDTEKQFIRKLNFIALLCSFKSISEKSFMNESLDVYDKIPFNEEDLMDLIIRRVKYVKNGLEYSFDLGIKRTEVNINHSTGFYYKSAIEDLGDLSVFFGYEDYDFEGMEISPGKTYPVKFDSIEEIQKLNLNDLYNEGFTNVILNSKNFDDDFSPLAINIIQNQNYEEKTNIKIGEIPNFVIKKNEKVKYVIINGFIYDVINSIGDINNGLILQ